VCIERHNPALDEATGIQSVACTLPLQFRCLDVDVQPGWDLCYVQVALRERESCGSHGNCRHAPEAAEMTLVGIAIMLHVS
jgi:hypothetical protein